MSQQGRTVSRFIGAMAVLLALAVAIVPPALWFAFSQGSLRAHLKKEAERGALMVSRLVAANPLLWQYDEVRLRWALEGSGAREAAERRRVYDAQGTVAEVAGADPESPVVSESATVWDAGRPAGRVEAGGSLRPLLRDAALLGVLSTAVSAGILFLFLLFPAKAVRKALDSLAEQKERFNATFQSITDGIISTGPDGKVLLMNRAAESITGWSREQAVGKDLGVVLPLRDAEGGPVSPAELPEGKHGVLHSPDGGRRLVDVRVAPMDARGNPVLSAILLRDVTAQKRMEEEIVRAQKLESLGLLAGGIAHDFNNLLTGVLGNISLAKDMMDPGRKERRRLDEAEKATLKAKELAGRLLSFSKGGMPDRREIAVEEVIRDAALLAVGGTSVRCDFRMPAGLWSVSADAGQIGQVIGNLAVNAVQAMPAGGVLRIEAENATVGESEIPHVKAGEYVRVTVSDEGCGIPPEVLPRIFEPYFTTKENGTGLGLATCYTIMKGHGGNIFAESPPGGGATFRLFLPSTGKVPRAAEPPGEQPAFRGEGKVLLMDDEETVREVAGEMLAHLGYEPRFARDGAEAVELYAREAAGPGKFDLVILDLAVPGGMGGKEAASRILEMDPDARIVVSSGRADDPAMSEPRKHGFAGAAEKPYQLADLSRVLRGARCPREAGPRP
jgi:PAS domain S-box-containing protein